MARDAVPRLLYVRVNRLSGTFRLIDTIPASPAAHPVAALPDNGRVLPAADGPERLAADIAGGRVRAFSTLSPDKPEDNQDAALMLQLDEDSALLAVADGAGGIAGGRRAARMALSTLRDSVANAAPGEEGRRDAVIAGFEEANLAVIRATRGAATTLTAALVEGRMVQVFHVGDSVGLVTGQRSRVKMQTVAHSPVGFAIAAGYLTEEQAIYHPERHIVSNFVGTHEMLIEVGPRIRMAARDRILLASDGLTDNLHLAEILAHMRSGPLDGALDALVSRAGERMRMLKPTDPGKPDDIVVILFDKRP